MFGRTGGKSSECFEGDVPGADGLRCCREFGGESAESWRGRSEFAVVGGVFVVYGTADEEYRMSDYISREAALEALCADCCAKECNKELCQDWHNLSVVPAADVRPVVRGMWKLNKDGSGVCSVCGRTQLNCWDLDNWDNYCHHCGADMRGES